MDSEVAYKIISVNTLIVGAGAAGLKCAYTLASLGVKDIAVVVDRLGNGTSNNSGSDKQTYYKIGIFGDEPDSPMDFARSLFNGGMMHGDLAYIEALGSAPAFFDLCRIGVPFPFNAYGAYVGYKTDHDPRQRATSAGPKTSKFMYECLLRQVRREGIAIYDGHEVIKLLTDCGRAVGAICLDRNAHYREDRGMVVFNASNVVLATGGPGELYRRSAWPCGQIGSHGMAFDAGAGGNNLTELQYGLASTDFRWNLSGTYQQVMPDYFSLDSDGKKRHFLWDYFPNMATLALNVFLKGYQWPFHAARLQREAGGTAPSGEEYFTASSLVDIAVYNEMEQGREVYMDFMHNLEAAPGWRPFNLSELPDEARNYLERSNAMQGTPYLRLQKMNQASIDLYAEHGIDLRKPLKVAVCAQHCNGGISCDCWWETSVRHLFAIGELCGTHGVRPGGSALNSGQVGAYRAALRIARVYNSPPIANGDFLAMQGGEIEAQRQELEAYLQPGGLKPQEVRREIQLRMTASGAFMRSLEDAETALRQAKALYHEILEKGFACLSVRQLPQAIEDKWLALTSVAFLQAIVSYIRRGGGSRGAFMVLDKEGSLGVQGLPLDTMRHRPENLAMRKEILELRLKQGSKCEFEAEAIPVRPLPTDDSWYENTWADYQKGLVFK